MRRHAAIYRDITSEIFSDYDIKYTLLIHSTSGEDGHLAFMSSADDESLLTVLEAAIGKLKDNLTTAQEGNDDKANDLPTDHASS